jgi:hypothetical protein
MLGLARRGGQWRLVLLWYAPPVVASAQMRSEIDRFTEGLGGDAVYFETRTYQDLWPALKARLGVEHDKYGRFMDERYFRSR